MTQPSGQLLGVHEVAATHALQRGVHIVQRRIALHVRLGFLGDHQLAVQPQHGDIAQGFQGFEGDEQVGAALIDDG